MKQIRIVLVAILFLLGGRMAAQWELLAPLDTTWNNTYVKFFNDSTGVVVAARYSDLLIMKTLDYGNSWDTIYYGNQGSNNFFVNENVGYRCSYNQPVLKTIDGGYTWYNPNLDPEADYFFEKIFFTDELHGYGVAIGPYGETTDGGATWTIENFSMLSGYDIYFSDECHGFTSGEGNYFGKTSDCGANWQVLEQVLDPPNYYARGVYFIDEQNGFIAGDWNLEDFPVVGAYIARTSDSGDSWIPVVLHDNVYQYTSMQFQSELVGYCVGYCAQSVHNAFLKTTDGGNTWGWQEAEIYPEYIEGYGYPEFVVASISCPSADTCYAVGNNGAIWRTFYGGGPVYELPVSVQELTTKPTVKVYPNPAQTSITFEGIKTTIKECVVYDNTGRVVLAENNLHSNTLNVEKLKSGLYHVRLKVGEQYLQVRFVKE